MRSWTGEHFAENMVRGYCYSYDISSLSDIVRDTALLGEPCLSYNS